MYYTKPNFSTQIIQYPDTTAILSGYTSFLQGIAVKNININTSNPVVGYALIYDGTEVRFQPAGSGLDQIIFGMNVSVEPTNALQYNIANGLYQINGVKYPYLGGNVLVSSGNATNSRFDVLYITTGGTVQVLQGSPAASPSVPVLSAGQLLVSTLLIPAGYFSGSTGSTIISNSSTTQVFEYTTGSTGGIQRQAVYNSRGFGPFSFAPGRNSIAYGQDSTTLGLDTIASANSQTVVGQFNIPNTNTYFLVGNGNNNSDRKNAFSIDYSGNTNVFNRLFIKNVEIELTGSTTNNVLKFINNKYTPSKETFDSLSSATSGISLSYVSGNTIFVKNISGGNVNISEQDNVLTFNVDTSDFNYSATSVGNGQSLISSSTPNNISLFSLSGNSGVNISESNGVIYISTLALSGTNIGGFASVFKRRIGDLFEFRTLRGDGDINVIQNVNDILISSTTRITGTTTTGLTGGFDIITGVINKEIVSRRVIGLGSVSLSISGGTLLISGGASTGGGPSITYSGTNIGGAIPVFKQVSSDNFEFRTFSGNGRTVVSQVGDIIVISSPNFITSGTSLGGGVPVYSGYNNNELVFRTITATNRNTISTSLGLINIIGTVEVNSGGTRNLALYRNSGEQVHDSVDNIFVKVGTHSATSNRVYTIPDVKSNADFLMTQDNQIVHGKKEFYSGITIGSRTNISNNNFDTIGASNIYNLYQPNKVEPLYQLNNASSIKISGATYIKEYMYETQQNPVLGSLSGNNFTILKQNEYNFLNPLIESNNLILNFNKYRVLLAASNTPPSSNNHRIVGTYDNYTITGFDTQNTKNSDIIGNLKDINLTSNAVNTVYRDLINTYYRTVSSLLVQNTIDNLIDLYIDKVCILSSSTLNGPVVRNAAGIYIAGKDNSIISKDILNNTFFSGNSKTTFTNRPWSIFAESDRAFIGNTLILGSGLTLSSTTRGSWLDIGQSQNNRPHINFSAGTNVSSPIDGDLWYNGTNLYFRKGGSTLDLLSSSGGLSGITGAINTGDGIGIFSSATDSNLILKTLSGTPSVSVWENNGVIYFSSSTSSPITGTYISGITSTTQVGGGIGIVNSATTHDLSIKTFSSTTPNLLIYTSSTAPNLVLFSSTTQTAPVIGSSGITTATTVGDGVKLISSVTSTELKLYSLSGYNGTSIFYKDNLIGISSDTSYYETIDQSEAINIFNSKTPTYKIGKWYKIINRSDTGNNTYGDILTFAVSTYELSYDCYLLGFLADYNAVGDYSDAAFSSPAIPPLIGNSYSSGNIIIFNNRHYGVTTTFTLNTESDILANCTELPKSYTTNNGYLNKLFKIKYSLTNDTIYYMSDEKMNEVHSFGVDNINTFNFALEYIHQNIIHSTAGQVNIINVGSDARLYGNTFFKLSNFIFDSIGFSSINVYNSNINDSTFSIENQSLSMNSISIFNKNTDKQSTINLVSDTITLSDSDKFFSSEVLLDTSSANRTATTITNTYTYQPNITFTVNGSYTVTFKNSSTIKTEGGLDAIINGSTNDSITFKRVGSVYYQININNYI